jgi:uncharacterized protein with HEPN domain
MYDKDRKNSSAERQLVIIGEALNKLRVNENDFIIENGLANYWFSCLVHAYDSIDNSIWAILNRHLEKLKLEIEI